MPIMMKLLITAAAFPSLASALKFSPFSMSKKARLGELWKPLDNGAAPPRSGSCAAVDEEGRTWLFGGYAETESDGAISRRVVNDLWLYEDDGDGDGGGKWEQLQPPSDDFSVRPRPRLAAARLARRWLGVMNMLAVMDSMIARPLL